LTGSARKEAAWQDIPTGANVYIGLGVTRRKDGTLRTATMAG